MVEKIYDCRCCNTFIIFQICDKMIYGKVGESVSNASDYVEIVYLCGSSDKNSLYGVAGADCNLYVKSKGEETWQQLL